MARVPDTHTFSLQDVVDVVNPTSDTLQGCFDDSIEGYFDLSHKGDMDRLSNFRNYGPSEIITPQYSNYSGAFTGGNVVSGSIAMIYPDDLDVGSNKRLYMVIQSAAQNTFTNVPAGWSLISSHYGVSQGSYYIWEKVVQGDEAGLFYVNYANLGFLVYGAIFCFENVTSATSVNNFIDFQYGSAYHDVHSVTSNQMSLTILGLLGNQIPSNTSTGVNAFFYASTASSAGGTLLAMHSNTTSPSIHINWTTELNFAGRLTFNN